MNIGTLIRGLLGDNKPGAAKSLELKEGQVVRGVVLSVSDSGKEAVVQIQGTPVRAELETPLLPGETLNLQVGAPGEGGLPVLKPVSLGETVLATPQNMGEALESLGLTDSKAGREIVLAMQSGGIPLTKETAAILDAVMSAKPAGVPTSEWLDAAVISVKRGLPVTPESVKGLQQAVFGPQLHQLLSALEEQITIWAGQVAGEETTTAEAKAEMGTQTGKLNAPVTTGTGAVINGEAVSAGDADAEMDQVAVKGTGQPVSKPAEGSAGFTTTSGSAAATGGAMGAGVISDETAIPLNSVKSEISGSAATSTAEAPENETGIVTAKPLVPEEAGEVVQLSKSGNTGEPLAGKTTSTIAAGTQSSAANTQGDGIVNNQNSSNGSETHGNEMSLNKDRAQGSVSGANTSATGSAGADSQAAAANQAGAASQAAAPSGAALLAKLQGVLTELRGSMPQLANVPPADAAGQDPAPAPAAPRGETTAAAASPVQPDTAPPADAESWVGRVLKLLGAEHEQQAVRGGALPAAETARAAAGTAAAALGSVGGEQAADTLKGVLLQLMSSSEVPPAVKDAASGLVQQLTGQQLLLNTDRTAPFAQVTLFLPLQGPDGQETASVHIQSRRGRKGELDAANCRLWFDLDMKQLGQTLVDVQVVDRIVSLKLHNDHPWVLELLETRREDIKTAVESIGYQLSGLRTEPLPELNLPKELAGSNTNKFVDYVPEAYKGVDYRI
ncbi:DNA ligase [Paenibacillus sp. FSL R10-2779]|uniref:DNA ligase n=1 Tax=Paenibacillus sp. FSL R10-2779 TaxID=2975340 RepID=UPI0030FB37E2